jgi:hypothetical protein
VQKGCSTVIKLKLKDPGMDVGIVRFAGTLRPLEGDVFLQLKQQYT